MKASVQESLERGIVFAAIGVAVALAVPALLTSVAATIGFAAGGLLGAATVAGVLGSAVAFGGFGILYPRLKSLFGPASDQDFPGMTSKTIEAKLSDSRQIDDARHSSGQALPKYMGEQAETAFRQKIDAERIAQSKASGRLSI